MPIPMTPLTWMVKNIPNRNTMEDFTEEIHEAEYVRRYNFFHLLMKKLYLCLALMKPVAWCCATFFELCDHDGINATLGRDVGLPQSSEGQPTVDHSSRFLPPDMLAMRTAGPNWNHAKLYGSFAASWLFLMKRGESGKGNMSLVPNGPVYAVIFVNDSSIMNQTDVPLDDDGLREDYYNEDLAFP